MVNNFKGIWISRELWQEKDLSMTDKVFIAIIKSLSIGGACFASNQYLADFFGVSTRHIKRTISELIEKGYLKTTFEYKNGTHEISKRFIILTKKTDSKFFKIGGDINVTGGGHKCHGGGDINVTHITKSYIKIKEQSLIYRKKEFSNSLFLSFENKYPVEMLEGFFDYWTEHNTNGKKMRFEMEKVFNIKRRLGTWSKNSKNYSGKKNNSAMDLLKQKHGL